MGPKFCGGCAHVDFLCQCSPRSVPLESLRKPEREFWIIWNPSSPKPPTSRFLTEQAALTVAGNMARRYPSSDAEQHFGIDNDEVRQLFGMAGCGGATTPKAAARYIEKFVKAKGFDLDAQRV